MLPKKGGFQMPLNNFILASKIFLLSIPVVIVIAGLWWLYMEL